MMLMLAADGVWEKVLYLLSKLLAILSCVILVTNAGLADNQLKAPLVSPTITPLVAPTIPDLPQPANLSLFHRPRQKHSSQRGAPSLPVAASHPPFYGPLITSAHPPTSSSLSKPSKKMSSFLLGSTYASNCCKPNTVRKPRSHGCHCVYPIKLDLLLLDVVIIPDPDWIYFRQDLASQLGLRFSQIKVINSYVVGFNQVNISMYITPHTGISFSASDASAINSSLAMHRVQFEYTVLGDYQLLNLTWFEPPTPALVPHVGSSPVKGPTHQTSTYILIIAILSVLLICWCVFRERKTKSFPKETTTKPKTMDAVPVGGGSFPHPSGFRFLAYEELKKATNNFEPASIIGEDGFGKVFKGVLSDGTAIAIKRLTSGGQEGDKEFLAEIEMLSRLHHRNLVKLVGYYSSRDSSQHLICYELVPNGSLEAWLHGLLGVKCPLDWDTRMKIALDAASGLAYLHEDSQPCVIHRDFKASNILLENNFNAKVADFGLAKQAPEGKTTYLSTRVMGTFGYVAPEYSMTGHLQVKIDVYSYGVVLIELLTGRKPVEMSQPSGQQNLVTWAMPILRDKDRVEELGDPWLGGKYLKEDFVRVCRIAAACVAPEASQRPTMGEVVQSLKMVQRNTEHQHLMLASSNNRANLTKSYTIF